MKATNSLANRENKPKNFSAFINDEKIKKGIVERFGGDAMLAARFISTITAAVQGNEKLQECDYGSIVTAALTGEVGMNLSYALGQYGIIPYGKVAKYQLQVNGLKQLCIRSKAYSKIGCYDVRQGEFLGRDPQTREPVFKWIEDEDERLKLPIIGYYALYMLSPENNNFFQCLYWSHEKILRHADRYSAGFSLETYRALLAGELSPEETAKLQGTNQRKGSSPWYANPDEDAHMKMCMKTALKQLLNDGLAPKSIQEVIIEDDDIEAGPNIPDLAEYTVVESTGEVIDAQQDAPESPESDSAPQVTNDTAEPEKPQRAAKRGRRPQEVKPIDVEADDAIESFFGDDE